MHTTSRARSSSLMELDKKLSTDISVLCARQLTCLSACLFVCLSVSLCLCVSVSLCAWWGSGCVGVWVCGCVGVWVCVSVWVCGCHLLPPYPILLLKLACCFEVSVKQFASLNVEASKIVRHLFSLRELNDFVKAVPNMAGMMRISADSRQHFSHVVEAPRPVVSLCKRYVNEKWRNLNTSTSEHKASMSATTHSSRSLWRRGSTGGILDRSSRKTLRRSTCAQADQQTDLQPNKDRKQELRGDRAT